MVIRLARADEVDIVARISRDAYAIYLDRLGPEPKPMVQDYAAPIQRAEVSILELDGVAAGVLVLEKKPDHLLIYSIALDPAFQGRGLGTELMRFSETVARADGLPALRLYTNEKMVENIAFYSALGFKETGRRPHERYRDSILVFMTKAL
jgi:ribosomal protein S18 acetylase RimI-like enzyme